LNLTEEKLGKAYSWIDSLEKMVTKFRDSRKALRKELRAAKEEA
jgi:outer membrane murein-binding lipoprotein Lpp